MSFSKARTNRVSIIAPGETVSRQSGSFLLLPGKENRLLQYKKGQR